MSLIPLISKVIEKVTVDQISTFLKLRNLLDTYQSGFWKKHVTDFCFSYLKGKIANDFDKSMITGMTLIDLEKVFNTIHHDILLQKLDATGFVKCTVSWFISHLPIRPFFDKEEIVFLDLRLFAAVYPKVLFWGKSCF